MRLLAVLKGLLANVDVDKIEFTYNFEGDSITVKCARCNENNYMWIRESHSSSTLDSDEDCAIWEHWGIKTTYHVFTLGAYPEYDAIWQISVLGNEESIRLYGRRSLLGIQSLIITTKYKYLNPKTKKFAETEDYNLAVIEQLFEDKENDIVLVTSSNSWTFKMYRYHFEGYAGDWEGPELIVECPIATLKNYLTL